MLVAEWIIVGTVTLAAGLAIAWLIVDIIRR